MRVPRVEGENNLLEPAAPALLAGTRSGSRSDRDPVWKMACDHAPETDRSSRLATVTTTPVMKTPASSAAAKRHARQAQKLQCQRKQPAPAAPPPSLDPLKPLHRRAAGIDVGSAENYVAREATGIDWLALYDKLEAAGIEVYRVDAHAVRAVPGRKSDWLDCPWLQKRHTDGLLARAFRPDAPIRRLRTLTRQRAHLGLDGAAHPQRMEKALISMNLQLPRVVSDLLDETGLRILRAILEGQRDPQAPVQRRDPRCRKKHGGGNGRGPERHLRRGAIVCTAAEPGGVGVLPKANGKVRPTDGESPGRDSHRGAGPPAGSAHASPAGR